MKDLGPSHLGHAVGMTHAGTLVKVKHGHATGDNNFAAPSHMRFLDTW